MRPSVHIYFRNERRAWLAARVCRTRSLSCSSRVFLLRLLPRLVLMDLSGRWYARRKCYCLFFFCSLDPAAATNMSCHPKKKLPGFDYCQLLRINSKCCENLNTLCLLHSALLCQRHMLPDYLTITLLKNIMSCQLVVKEFHSSYENPLVTHKPCKFNLHHPVL